MTKKKAMAIGFMISIIFCVYVYPKSDIFCCWQISKRKKNIIYPKINARDEDDVIIKTLNNKLLGVFVKVV